MSIRELQKRIHALNRKWWFDQEGNRLDRNKGELIALFHSEQSEATEGVLTGAMDDKLPNRLMDEVEMADTKIRILDYAVDSTFHPNAVCLFMDMAHQYYGHIASKLAQHAIIHLHLSKAMESERKGRTAAVPAWLKGALFLIEQYCKMHSLDLDGAVEEKLAFNQVRVDHTYEARARADGKKW